MLGHLKPRSCRIQPDVKQHYQRLYCSLCYSLRRQFGLSASFLISHELTLCLAAFSESAVLPVESCACPAKLFCQQKPIVHAPLIDRAAQLCLLLVWLKLVDSETDNPAFYKKNLRLSIENKIQPILASLNPITRQFIEAYLLLIRVNSTDFSTTAKMSGLLAQHIFRELCQEKDQIAVTEITLLLGELITVADALLDVKKDIQHQQYNPIINASLENNTSLAEEYTQLKTNYDKLAENIIHLIHANLTTINPLFSEILQQSLHNLTAKIQQAHYVLFANNQRRDARRSRWSECFGSCCDCFDCCECCGEGSCCECGGCDCG